MGLPFWRRGLGATGAEGTRADDVASKGVVGGEPPAAPRLESLLLPVVLDLPKGFHPAEKTSEYQGIIEYMRL